MNFDLDKMAVVHVSTVAYLAMVQTLDKLHLVVVRVVFAVGVPVAVVVVVVSVQMVQNFPTNHQITLQSSFLTFVYFRHLAKFLIISWKKMWKLTLIDSFSSA